MLGTTQDCQQQVMSFTSCTIFLATLTGILATFSRSLESIKRLGICSQGRFLWADNKFIKIRFSSARKCLNKHNGGFLDNFLTGALANVVILIIIISIFYGFSFSWLTVYSLRSSKRVECTKVSKRFNEIPTEYNTFHSRRHQLSRLYLCSVLLINYGKQPIEL